MAVPTDVLWERDPHTAAKHTLLRRYLSAWFPIMAKQFRDDGITFFPFRRVFVVAQVAR